MLKFFRKIRQSLLSENKFSKYLIYAIGEIVLVVIGILIAIQLNSVQNDNEKRIEEITHLENLLSDLKQDRAELDKIIERRISKSNSSKILQGIHNTQEVDNTSDYYSHLMNVVYWDAHNPSLLTFNELINSGKLSSLSNEKIKFLLLQIDYNYNELFEVRKHLYEDHWEYFYRPFADIIDYESAIIAWSEPEKDIELSNEFVETALKSKRIKNGFTLSNFNNNLLREKLSEILTKVDSTIVLIEEEIDK
ncbi:DUF6090 family protein [Balneola sp. MJW-20]|uniref:DUF6090 family protein n=1 Tax=Gracilimonas aurantiaca TaxID=3234185 RepID=UPI003465B35F